MPIYILTAEDGDSIEVVGSMKSPPQWRRRNGKTYFRNIPAQWSGRTNMPGNWPCESEMCGVAPEQIEHAMGVDKGYGVPARYNSKTGAVIWESPRHRREWCEAHGYYDRNAGYSDPVRRE